MAMSKAPTTTDARRVARPTFELIVCSEPVDGLGLTVWHIVCSEPVDSLGLTVWHIVCSEPVDSLGLTVWHIACSEPVDSLGLTVWHIVCSEPVDGLSFTVGFRVGSCLSIAPPPDSATRQFAIVQRCLESYTSLEWSKNLTH